MAKVLFEITEEKLDTGLRGFPVGYCVTSFVDPEKGLYYSDKPLSTLSEHEPQEVIYLLYHGKEGSKEEVKAFFKELQKRSRCSEAVIKQIHQLPKEANPMKLFAIGLLLLGGLEGTGDYHEDCLNVIAKMPHLVACIINHHGSFGKTPLPFLDKGYMESFTEMLGIPGKPKILEEAMKLFNIIHYDHGGGNLSTFVGKAVASGLEDMYGSLASAMCALAGPLHGGANRQGLQFVQETYAATGDDATVEDVEAFIRAHIASGKVAFGFGHAVLRLEDPRAAVQYAFIKKHFPHHPLVKTAFLIRAAGPKVLKENPKIADPYPNVDAVSGVVLTASGFAYPEYFTLLFGLSRCVGIAIQIVYDRKEARSGKGTPIVRPKYLYKSRHLS